MQILRQWLEHLTARRSFFYNWEERAFERRLEQSRSLLHFTCRNDCD